MSRAICISVHKCTKHVHIQVTKHYVLFDSTATICVWNRHDTTDHYNREYTKANGTHIDQPYWIKQAGSCGSNYYIIWVPDIFGGQSSYKLHIFINTVIL